MHTKLATKEERTIHYEKNGVYVLPPGRFLDVGDPIQKGDVKIWTDAKPESVESEDCVERGFGPGSIVQPRCARSLFYRPSKKHTKKVKPVYENSKGPLAGYTTLGPDEFIQDGDIWFSPTFPEGTVVTHYGKSSREQVKDYNWRTYKRPPVKNLEPGSRVIFDLSSLAELKGVGTILDRQLDNDDSWLVWLDKPVLGQNVLTIPKKLLKVE